MISIAFLSGCTRCHEGDFMLQVSSTTTLWHIVCCRNLCLLKWTCVLCDFILWCIQISLHAVHPAVSPAGSTWMRDDNVLLVAFYFCKTVKMVSTFSVCLCTVRVSVGVDYTAWWLKYFKLLSDSLWNRLSGSSVAFGVGPTKHCCSMAGKVNSGATFANCKIYCCCLFNWSWLLNFVKWNGFRLRPDLHVCS